MSVDPAAKAEDDTSLAPLEAPGLPLALDRIGVELERFQVLGLISVTVMRRSRAGPADWSDYESVRERISSFLSTGFRATDTVVEPVVSGNTYIVLLGGPRKNRPVDVNDLRVVQSRMATELNSHLAGCVHPAVLDRFGVHVGAALLQHEPGVDCERVVHRSLDEAIADALERVVESSEDEFRIRRLLVDRGISAVYQPLVDLQARAVIGYEALTRVSSSYTRPDLMFVAARDCGLLWPLERACREEALASLPRMHSETMLFLNLERESLDDPALVGKDFLENLEGCGLDPSRVVLEITEHARRGDLERSRLALQRCRDHGFRLAVDDVGAGYSGLLAVAEVEPDYLKVDMNLVRDIHRQPVKRELIKTICRFTENTGITLVAEGVESTDELSSLTDLGVRCAQGFLFARPGAPPRDPEWGRLIRLLF